jgi:hypothetical protein
MKIYITDIFPSSLKNKLTNLREYLSNTISRYEMVSEECGIHIIEEDAIYRVEPNFKPDINVINGTNSINGNNIKNDLLIDNTNYKMIPVVSQLPFNYILTKMTIYEYQVSKKSKMKMVIECLNEPVPVNIFFANAIKNSPVNTETTVIPINFYFVYDDVKIDLTDRFVKEEINVFLSHLN